MNVHNNIKYIFDNMTYFEEYNSDIWFTIIAFLITIVIIIYFYINNFIKSHRSSWEQNKCNPIYMPFADYFVDDSNDKNNVEENFNKCLNNFNFGIANDSKKPLDIIFGIIKNMFAFFSSIISQIVAFFMYLLNLITQIFFLLIQKVQFLIHNINIFLIRTKAFMQNIIDTIIDIYYLLIVSTELFVHISIASFQGIANTTLISAIIAFLSALISMLIFMIIASIPLFGSWAIPVAALFKVLFVISLIYLIFSIFITISIYLFTGGLKSKLFPK